MLVLRRGSSDEPCFQIAVAIGRCGDGSPTRLGLHRQPRPRANASTSLPTELILPRAGGENRVRSNRSAEANYAQSVNVRGRVAKPRRPWLG